MEDSNKKMFTLLGTGILLFGFILFILLVSLFISPGQQNPEVDLAEEAITSRYITTSTPILENREDLPQMDNDDVNESKQGILEVQESRKVVKVETPLSQTEIDALEEKYDVTFSEDEQSNGIYVVSISPESDLPSLQNDLDARVETDIPIKMFADTIDWGISRIGADKVWSSGSGSGIKVAVVDTGVQKDHPDLVSNLLVGYDFVNGDSDANDDNGHGTHVAGITSSSFNQAGVVGVGHSAKILPVKVLNAQGYGYLSDVAKGIYYAADNGARVINLSLGSPTDSLILKDAVNYAANKGVLVVAAAGNDGGAPCSYPGAYTNAVCVVATDKNNLLASFSNIGGELAAPGVYNYSTYIGSTYKYLSGTSMATPHVSGAAALLMSICTTCSTSEIRTLLRESAIDLGEVGKDILFGYGLIDLTTAVAQLEPEPVEETPQETPVIEEPEEETPQVVPVPKKTKTVTPQVISITQPLLSKGNKYIPTEVGDIEVKYTLTPITEENNVSKITVYVDNKEIESSTQQSGSFILSQELFNHSQHWIKVEAVFNNGTKSTAQIVVDMTYLKSLSRSNNSGKSVLGISISIFDWLGSLW